MPIPSNPTSLIRRSVLSGRALSVMLPLFGLGWTAGCGDDSSDPASAGGNAGSAKGGKAGKGGSSGASSKAGASGKGGSGAKGGTTGEAGSESGGSSGAGKGGSGGHAGDDSGATGGTGATGGSTGGSTGGTNAQGGSAGESGAENGGSAGDGLGGEAGSDAGGNGGEGGEPPVAPVTITKVFPISTTGPDRLYGVAYAADGSIFGVGQIAITTDTTADYALLLVKFTSQGNLDTTFGAGGVVVRNVAAAPTGPNAELYRGVTVQSSGKVVVSGTVDHVGGDARDRDIAVLRFNTDGSKDTTWGTDGVVTLDLSTGVVNGSNLVVDSNYGLARYPDDRIVVSGGLARSGGTDTDFALVRLNADGTRDGNFGTNGLVTLDTQLNTTASDNASPRYPTILPGTDGVIGGGYRPLAGHDTAPLLWKVTDGGVVDTTFGTNGVFSDVPLPEQTESYQAAVQPLATGTGYDLVTTGYGKSLAAETTDLVSLRVSSAGVLDTTYGNSGSSGVARVDVGGFGDNSRRLVVLPDRKVLMVGGGRLTSADVDGIVLRLTPDGVPDNTFEFNGFRRYDLGGLADFLWDVAISPDQKMAAIVGIKGWGTTPPANVNDDVALVLLPLP